MRKMMMCIGVAIAACAAFAWPLPDEVEKAKPIVEELMAAKGALKPGEAADAAVELAAASKTEAAKYLLLSRAVELYAKAGDDERTAATFVKMIKTVKDVPTAIQERILLAAGRVLTKFTHPVKTEAIFIGVRAFVWAEKELSSARMELKKSKVEAPAAHLRAGNALAVMGDWSQALDHLLGAKGKIAPVADHEINGTATADRLANAWWKAAETSEGKYVKSAYRLHAAELYRKALGAKLLEGLNMNLAETRIAEVEKGSEKDAVMQLHIFRKEIEDPSLKWRLAKNFETPKVQEVYLEDGVKMAFCAIPPGTFQMSSFIGASVGAGKEHTVTISRPFWITRTFVTAGEVRAILPVKARDEKLAEYAAKFPQYDVTLMWQGKKLYERFCETLNERYSELLPKGYEFRLPTEAELIYAVRQGGKLQPVYFNGSQKALKECKTSNFKIETDNGTVNYNFGFISRNSMNDWGLYGGFADDNHVLDTLGDNPNIRRERMSYGALAFYMRYTDGEIDPVRRGIHPMVLVRYGKLVKKDVTGSARIVIAPKDLNVYPKK